MPTLGASLAASLAAWLVDALVSPVANTPIRILANLAVSVWVFVLAKRWLRDLRGD